MPRYKVPFTTLGTDQSQFNATAFQRLHNVAMREPEMVEPLPGRDLVASNYASSSHTARRMWGVSDQATAYEIALARDAGSGYQLRAILESGSSAPTIAANTLLGMPCGLAEARKRPIYAGPCGALVFDDDVDAARMLGMLPPTFIAVASSTTTNAQAVPVNSRVAWRATLHRRHEDGYEITSAPSYAIYAETAGAIRDFTIRVGWLGLAPTSDPRVRSGDILRLWRARAVASGASTNDRYLLTAEIVLDSSHISDRYADITDVTPDAGLAAGEELYTNPGMQGAAQANWQLGPSGDVAVYNGHAFYAERSLPAYKKLRISSRTGYLGTTVSQVTYGVGVRGITASHSGGSPTITGVSSTVGIEAGQRLAAATVGALPAGAIVNSVDTGASTITFNTNASGGGGPSIFYVTDMMEINGTALRFANVQTLLYDAWDNDIPVIITPDAVVDGIGYTPGTGAISLVSVDLDGLEMAINSIAPYGVEAGDLTIRATNGQNYSPALPSLADSEATGEIDERLNRVKWSKLDQPEHVPAGNELVVGKAEHVRFVSTQDRLFAFCTDGAYVISGNGGSWSVDAFDLDLEITNQAAADTMNGNVYVYAKRRGLLRIDPGGGVVGLTKGAIQRALDELARGLADTSGAIEVHLACDEVHNEVGLFMRQPAGGESADVAELAYIFNERTSSWRTQTPGVAVTGDAALEAWCWSPRRNAVVWSQGGSSGGSPDIYTSLPDSDMSAPIPGGFMRTYPIAPDGSTAGMQRFHEIALTLSNVSDIDPAMMLFIVSTGMTEGITFSSPKALPGNASNATEETPAFFQLRHMVRRATHLGPSLVVNVRPSSVMTTRWRLHAIEVAWEPASARSYAR